MYKVQLSICNSMCVANYKNKFIYTPRVLFGIVKDRNHRGHHRSFSRSSSAYVLAPVPAYTWRALARIDSCSDSSADSDEKCGRTMSALRNAR